jgi:phospholipid/cholesterol/gamma-HCH transport system substrate-binding protein
MQRASAISAGLFFILGIIVFMVVFDLVKGGKGIHKGYELKARFLTVHDLKIGDPVKQAGVEIGQVRDLRIAGTNVEVSLVVRRGVQLNQDAEATVKTMGIFGQNYIGLSFGTPSAGRLEAGSYLQTHERPDFDKLIARIDTVATGFEGLNTTIGEAVKAFSGGEGAESPFGFLKDFIAENRSNLSNTLANISDVTLKLKSGQGTLGKLINDDSMYKQLSETGENVNQLVSSVRKGEGTMGKLFTDDTLYREATATMTDMHSIMNKINKGDGTLGKFVNDDSLFKNAKLTMQKLDKAAEGIEDQGPLSIIGIAAGALF